ncbi:MAG: hypothetical protein IJW49_05045 [Clostridia bacterium]|nr:hypothetical protein [Clostridia bacterium]
MKKSAKNAREQESKKVLKATRVWVQNPLCSTKKFDKLQLVEFFIQAAGLVYHHDAVVDSIAVGVYHQPKAVFSAA